MEYYYHLIVTNHIQITVPFIFAPLSSSLKKRLL